MGKHQDDQIAAVAPDGRELARRLRIVLAALGGEAHRRVVIEQLALQMGHDRRRIPQEFEAAVITCFEQARRDKRRRGGFHLPFGEGSYRWGLKKTG